MKRNYLAGLILLTLPILFAGCFPEDADKTIEECDLVVSYHNSEFNFGTVNYYYLPDTITYIVDENSDATFDHKYDSKVLSKVAENLNDLGWQRLYTEDSLHYDNAVTLFVSAFSTDYYTVYTYPWYDYWGWYWDFWFYIKNPTTKATSYYPYPYYPWNPGGAYYSYSTGTIVLEMANMEQAKDDKIPIEWVGVLNGMLYGITDIDRINDGIDQVFKQSPYLKH